MSIRFHFLYRLRQMISTLTMSPAFYHHHPHHREVHTNSSNSNVSLSFTHTKGRSYTLQICSMVTRALFLQRMGQPPATSSHSAVIVMVTVTVLAVEKMGGFWAVSVILIPPCISSVWRRCSTHICNSTENK